MKLMLLAAALVSLVPFAGYSVASAATAVRAEQVVSSKVTLADALAIRSVGALDANPAGRTLAVEAEDGILILDLQDGHVIKRLVGQKPHWSPNGETLAFFSRQSGLTQLHLWHAADDIEAQLTRLASGVLPNSSAMTGTCGASQVAWSPDSRSIAFVSMEAAGDEPANTEQAPATVRVYRGGPLELRSPVEAFFKNRAVLDGLLWESSFWRERSADDPVHAAVMNNVALRLETAANRLVTVDTVSRTVTFLPGQAAQYFCPAWSPDGRVLASVADLTEPSVSNERYGAMGSPASTTVALHDLQNGAERLLPALTFTRVRSVAWTGQDQRLVAIVEAGAKLSGFPRLAMINVADGNARLIDTPGGHAVHEIRAARDGGISVMLAGRFVNTLWTYDPRAGSFQQIPTFDWQVSDFDAIDARQMAFWAESSRFKGRLMVSGQQVTVPRLLYDANPQTENLALGEQRRVTWRNKRGDEVDGLVIFPPDYVPGRRYPAVVDAYPRPATDDFRLNRLIENTGHLLASEGFVIFRPAIRTPHGAYWFTHDEAYQMKAVGAQGVGLMLDDFESGVEALVAQGIADPRRIGIYGHSNGGWVANFLVTESKIPAAAVVSSGVSNAIMMALWPQAKATRGMDPATGGNVFDNFDDYVRLSPIFRMRGVSVPMLLIVGDNDYLWVPQMISQYGVLRAEGRDVTLVRYADEGHTRASPENALDAHRRITEFFHRHLGTAAGH